MRTDLSFAFLLYHHTTKRDRQASISFSHSNGAHNQPSNKACAFLQLILRGPSQYESSLFLLSCQKVYGSAVIALHLLLRGVSGPRGIKVTPLFQKSNQRFVVTWFSGPFLLTACFKDPCKILRSHFSQKISSYRNIAFGPGSSSAQSDD